MNYLNLIYKIIGIILLTICLLFLLNIESKAANICDEGDQSIESQVNIIKKMLEDNKQYIEMKKQEEVKQGLIDHYTYTYRLFVGDIYISRDNGLSFCNQVYNTIIANKIYNGD